MIFYLFEWINSAWNLNHRKSFALLYIQFVMIDSPISCCVKHLFASEKNDNRSMKNQTGESRLCRRTNHRRLKIVDWLLTISHSVLFDSPWENCDIIPEERKKYLSYVGIITSPWQMVIHHYHRRWNERYFLLLLNGLEKKRYEKNSLYKEKHRRRRETNLVESFVTSCWNSPHLSSFFSESCWFPLQMDFYFLTKRNVKSRFSKVAKISVGKRSWPTKPSFPFWNKSVLLPKPVKSEFTSRNRTNNWKLPTISSFPLYCPWHSAVEFVSIFKIPKAASSAINYAWLHVRGKLFLKRNVSSTMFKRKALNSPNQIFSTTEQPRNYRRKTPMHWKKQHRNYAHQNPKEDKDTTFRGTFFFAPVLEFSSPAWIAKNFLHLVWTEWNKNKRWVWRSSTDWFVE